jgi:ketopantoate reductase
MSTPRHVIFGTGAIGLATLDALRRRGETVRFVNRSGHVQALADTLDSYRHPDDATLSLQASSTHPRKG